MHGPSSSPLGGVPRADERLDDGELNWCRGMAVAEDRLFVTIDGRYGSGGSFGLLELDREGRRLDERRFQWSRVADEELLRFVTGFDILARPVAVAAEPPEACTSTSTG